MNTERECISASRFLHRVTMIAGEINTGKTILTQKFLDSYCLYTGGRAAVVDLAPVIDSSDLKEEHAGIGGSLSLLKSEQLSYYHCFLHAPRLRAKNEQEALRMAGENAHSIELLFKQALAERKDALFINDCSLYLHAGKADRLMEWIRSVDTVVVNGYYGKSLGAGVLSTRERSEMEYLIKQCDCLIRLSPDRSQQIAESGK